MNQFVDIDMENRNAWQGALVMLLGLCGEAADLSFDSRSVDGWKLPTLELRFDAPAELQLPQVTAMPWGTAEHWDRGTVLLAESKPEALPEGPVWLLKKNGAAAVIYRAFREAVRVLQEVGLPAEFAWSSLPLAPLCDDETRMGEKEKACWALGAIHTLWLRCEQDEVLQEALRKAGSCGQLQAQNMTTANTWILGQVEEELLLKAL
jgi:hypothetical protein